MQVKYLALAHSDQPGDFSLKLDENFCPTVTLHCPLLLKFKESMAGSLVAEVLANLCNQFKETRAFTLSSNNIQSTSESIKILT